ncbi:hypothetical protein Q1695_005665 [Nippostrongylus brasiliensis]|nr:hypothetical protein Q1695_005665 [Nippostrongylus brasiliensis]
MSTALMGLAEAMALVGASVTMLSISCGKDDYVDLEGDIGQASQSGSGESVPSKPATAPAPSGGSGEAAPAAKIPEFAVDLPDFKLVIDHKGPVSVTLLRPEFMAHLNTILASAGVFLWGANKRAAANAAAWKDIAKRLTALQAEGFDVLAGSDEAKERRKTMLSDKHAKPKLMEAIELTEKKKKKKVNI